jgi:DUF4097 and DUF4098 domain-containing protein YvlB
MPERAVHLSGFTRGRRTPSERKKQRVGRNRASFNPGLNFTREKNRKRNPDIRIYFFEKKFFAEEAIVRFRFVKMPFGRIGMILIK